MDTTYDDLNQVYPIHFKHLQTWSQVSSYLRKSRMCDLSGENMSMETGYDVSKDFTTFGVRLLCFLCVIWNRNTQPL